MKLVQRVLLILFTIFLSTTITFVLIRLMPGDPVTTFAMDIQRNQGIPLEDAIIRAKNMLNYDPDMPLYQQYYNHVSSMLKGDFGRSMQFKQNVSVLIGAALPWTLFISSVALAIAFILGSIMGMYIAWKRKSILDPIITVWEAIMGSIPQFVIAFLLILIFSTYLNLFPSRGYYGSDVSPGFNLNFILSVMYHGALPILAIVLTTVGSWALGMKGIAVSTLGEDYIVSARARGLSERRIISTYVGRNSLLPQITGLANAFAAMFAGSAMLEYTFVYPGIGYYFGRAISARDYPLMQGIFMIITIAVVLSNQVAEILYSVIDPRIRERG